MHIVGGTGSYVAITSFHRFERPTFQSRNPEKESYFLLLWSSDFSYDACVGWRIHIL